MHYGKATEIMARFFFLKDNLRPDKRNTIKKVDEQLELFTSTPPPKREAGGQDDPD